MFCIKCGEKLPDDVRFCFKCGTNLEFTKNKNDSTKANLAEPQETKTEQNHNSQKIKKCPHCSEMILSDATKCKFCHSSLKAIDKEISTEKIAFVRIIITFIVVFVISAFITSVWEQKSWKKEIAKTVYHESRGEPYDASSFPYWPVVLILSLIGTALPTALLGIRKNPSGNDDNETNIDKSNTINLCNEKIIPIKYPAYWIWLWGAIFIVILVFLILPALS